MTLQKTYSTAQAANALNISYGQIRWMFESGLFYSPAGKRGKKRKLPEVDLWKIGLASAMREAGLSIKLIKSRILDLMDLQLYRNLYLLYVHNEERYKFVATWDGQRWQVTTNMLDAINLYEAAKAKDNILILKNDDVACDSKTYTKQGDRNNAQSHHRTEASTATNK